MKTIRLPVEPARGVHRTNIGWTDYAMGGPVRGKRKDNGKVVNFCVKVAPGCRRCYAEQIGLRYKRGFPYTREYLKHVTPFLDMGGIRHILTFRPEPPHRAPDGRPKLFLGDMTDLFGEWVEWAWLDTLIGACLLRRDIDVQILTKRPEIMLAYLRSGDGGDDATTLPYRWLNAAHTLARAERRTVKPLYMGLHKAYHDGRDGVWPPRNIWWGTSVSDQKTAERNLPLLAACPGVVRYVSFEPALARVDFAPWLSRLDWVIVGGESGPEHEKVPVDVITDAVVQLRGAGVPVFVKQDAGQWPGKQGRIPDDVWATKQFPDAFGTYNLREGNLRGQEVS